ncbi:MAG: histidine kinase N-terminal 7TM domain-containing protein [Candidatus Limnocylindrales bacterium]
MQFNLLVLSYVLSAAVSIAVAVAAWRRRHMVGARELALLMLAIAWWLVASAFEASSIALPTKIAWAVIAYPGIESAPLLYLLFVCAWTRLDGWLTPVRIALLAVVPIVTVGMAATNASHHLLWPAVELVDAWGVSAVYEHGPWFWVQGAYALGLIAVGLVALVVAIFRYPAVYTPRLRLAILATLAPIAGSVLYMLGLEAAVHADLSSIAFAVSGLIGTWAVLRFRLLDVVPVAWPTLLDSLADALLVLDMEGRIAALSVSATRLLEIAGDATGQEAGHILRHVPGLVAALEGTGDREMEMPIVAVRSWPPPPGQPVDQPVVNRWLSIRVTAIADVRGRRAGSLVVLRDVSEHHRMVETIRALSNTDELTGLLNRRGFKTLGDQQIRTSIRTGNRLWLLFADLDGLKDINDRLGHEAGDRALCEVAGLLRGGSFRDADLVARLGGDEFAILATEVSPADGDLFATRVAKAVGRANGQPDREFTLSLSVGTAMMDPKQPQTLDALIRKADRRMYRAKHARRTAARPGP